MVQLQKLPDQRVTKGSFRPSAEFDYAVANFLSHGGNTARQTQIRLTTGTAGISFSKKVNKRPNWNLQPVHVVFEHTHTVCVYAYTDCMSEFVCVCVLRNGVGTVVDATNRTQLCETRQPCPHVKM